MVDQLEQRIHELITPYNPRRWLTNKRVPLTGETSLNMTIEMDEEEAYELLNEIFDEFGMNIEDINFFAYFPKSLRRKDMDKPLTIDMLVESAKAGKWLYD